MGLIEIFFEAVIILLKVIFFIILSAVFSIAIEFALEYMLNKDKFNKKGE